jgi:hypothetical protein
MPDMTSCSSPQTTRRARWIASATLTVSTVLGAAAPHAAASLDHGKTIRAFHVGNSVTDTITYTSFRTMAQGAGDTYVYGRHTISGTPLSGIYANPNRGFTTAPYGSYANALPNYEWDVVTLQPFDRMMYGFADSDIYAVRQFMDLTLSNPANADTQFYIYSRWPRREEITNPDGTKSYPPFDYQAQWDRSYTHLNWGNTYTTRNTNETRDYFNRLLGMVRAQYPTLQKQPLMVPVGDVFYALDQKLRTGIIPELTDVSGMYVDAIHFGDLGRFVVGSTYYATMYETPPTGLSSASYRSTQTHPGQAAQLDVTDPRFVSLVQQTVWDVVRQHPFAIGGSPQYSVDFDGSWSDARNWTRAQVPNQPTDVARLAYFNTARRNVQLDQDVRIERVEIDSPSGYDIAGPGTLTLNAATNSQALTLSARTPDMTIATSVRVGSSFRTKYLATQSLNIGGNLGVETDYTHDGGSVSAAMVEVGGTLLVSRGALRQTGDTSGRAGDVYVARGALFNIGTGGFVIDYAEGDTSPIDRLTADILAGRIISQPAGAPEAPQATVTAIDTAVTPVGDFNGRTPDLTSVVLMRVVAGDATLDGIVNLDDLVTLAAHFDEASGRWTAGDVNHDGLVDAQDLSVVADTYGTIMRADGSTETDVSLRERFSADWSLAQTLAVPEPTMLAVLGCAAAFVLGRKR